MSLKVYDAYKWEGTMLQLQEFLHQLRVSYVGYAVATLKRFSEYVEKRAMKNEHVFMFDICDLITKEITVGQLTPANIAASAVVYFYQDMILVQFFGLDDLRKTADGESLQDIVNKHKRLKDFHYQNQTDPYWEYHDKKYTKVQLRELQKDYRFREKVWKHLYAKEFTPSQIGLVFELSSHETIVHIADTYYNETRAK